MKNITLSLLLLKLSLGAVPEGYELVWSDEFDGSELDESQWHYREDSKHKSTQLAKNVSVSDGYLHLNLKKETAEGKDYTGAGVISKRRFKYGY
ncbi:MAG: glycoside hydrolase family 16 protein, partial [Verrucomicrobiales bacterium]